MKILLPIDGSELSLHEARFALRLVREGLRASFLLVNVQAPDSLYEIVTWPDPEVRAQGSHAAGEDALQPALALLREAGVECETAVVTGDPAHAVVDLIEEHACDLVIMGSRGTGALLSAIQGSVAQSMLHDSPVPVLLVKPPADEAPPATDSE